MPYGNCYAKWKTEGTAWRSRWRSCMRLGLSDLDQTTLLLRDLIGGLTRLD
jgi:hypothetical protein